MGTWGTGAFENDYAFDWLRAVEADGVPVIEESFSRMLDAAPEQRDALVVMDALAAAETVAAMAGNPSASLPPELETWISAMPRPRPYLVARAVEVVKAASEESSELRDLWAEVDKHNAWLTELEDLQNRLARTS